MSESLLHRIKRTSGLTFIKMGMEVIARGRRGRITGGNLNNQLSIKYDGSVSAEKHDVDDNVMYLDRRGNLIAEINKGYNR